MEKFAPIVIVDANIAGEALAIKHQLEVLISTVNRSSFDIADLLLKIKRKGYYAPYTTFQEYTASLKIKPRRARYLTRMASVMEEVGIPRSQYEPLGVDRLRDISSLEPADIWRNPITGTYTSMRDFIVAFVEYRTETGDFIEPNDLKRRIRTLKGLVGDNDFEFLTLSFQRATMESVVRPAIELAKAHIGSVKKDDEGVSQDATDSSAVVAILADYLSDPANDFAKLYEQEHSDMIANMEVDPSVIHDEGWEKEADETIIEVTI